MCGPLRRLLRHLVLQSRTGTPPVTRSSTARQPQARSEVGSSLSMYDWMRANGSDGSDTRQFDSTCVFPLLLVFHLCVTRPPPPPSVLGTTEHPSLYLGRRTTRAPSTRGAWAVWRQSCCWGSLCSRETAGWISSWRSSRYVFTQAGKMSTPCTSRQNMKVVLGRVDLVRRSEKACS